MTLRGKKARTIQNFCIIQNFRRILAVENILADRKNHWFISQESLMALVRLFQRHELDPEQKLEKGLLRRGISTMRQLLFQPERDMARAMDLSITAYRRLLEKLCTILSPVHITAYDLVHTSAKTVQALPTGILSLDRALKGGIACGNLTEVRQCCHSIPFKMLIHSSVY